MTTSLETRFSTLVFDLDGTLTDPSLGIVRCINHALLAHGFSAVPRERIITHIGPPLDEAFRALVPSASPALVRALVASFRDRYASVGFGENEVYPAIPRAIAGLAGTGRRLGVCTSKRRDFAEKILALFGLLEPFAFVDGGDIGITKREQLARLLAAETIDADAVMIGDREADIGAAHANGLASIAVLWGFAQPGEILGAAPTHIAASRRVARMRGQTVSPDERVDLTLVLFDIDDTLLDDAAAQRSAAAALHGQVGRDADLGVFLDLWSAAAERHYARYLQRELDFQGQRRARIREAVDETLSDAAADTLFDSYLDAYESAWALCADVNGCLDALGERHRLGVVSNGQGVQQRRKLDALGITDRFACIVISGELGHRKPSPEIFLEACAGLGAAPRKAVYVGDRYEIDALGAVPPA